MPLVKTRGIVIKHTNLGEADRIITLFTENLGKIQAVVHGSRKVKSRMLPSTQTFCYGEYVLYKGKSLYTVSQYEIRESFQGLLDDLYNLTYSSYIMELTDYLTQDDENNIELFMLVLKSLYLMLDKDMDKEFLVRAFELKSMAISGFMPILDECSICRMSSNIPVGFSIKHGGVVCSHCRDNDGYIINIDASTTSIMRFLLRSDLEKISNLKVSKENKNQMKKIMKNYIKYYLDREFKSLEFLDSIAHVDNL